jgi:hypothetical protein
VVVTFLKEGGTIVMMEEYRSEIPWEELMAEDGWRRRGPMRGRAEKLKNATD